MPAFDGSDDFGWVCGPFEGLWHLISLGDEAVDGGLEIDDGSEDATFQSLLGQLGEVTFHGVEPGARGRCEVEDEAHVPPEPTPYLGMLMGRVIIEDDVNDFSGGNLGFDGVEEADKLLMPVALHVAADDGAVEHVERGEQGRGAVPLVIVGHRSGTPFLHGKARLGAVERLDLAFLVKRQDNGVGGWVNIKANHITQFLNELGIGGKLELTHPVRLQTMRTPYALNRTD